MQSNLRGRQSGLPSIKMQSSSSEQLEGLRKVLIWSFSVSLISAAGIIFMAIAPDSQASAENYPVGLSMVLILAMVVSGLGFLIALGRLATRLGRSGITWVGLVIILPPIGALIAFPTMLSLIEEAKKDHVKKEDDFTST